MRKIHKLAALCAVFFIMLSFGITAHAEETPTESTPAETAAPTENTESAAPSDNAVENILPPGTGTVVDVFEGEDGKKFYTIQTPAGNTFYLILDFTRQAENVYFLDAVNEKDLLALAEQSGNGATGGTTANPDTNANTNSNSNATSDPSGNQTGQEQSGGNNNMSSMVLVVLVVLVGGGAGIYFKVIRKKQNTDSRDEYEDDYEETVPDSEEYSAEPEDADDSLPWEDEDV